MELINKTLFNYLINYPEMCIYALINQKEQKIYLGYTTNLPGALARIIKDLKYSNNKLKNDLDKLTFGIIETITDRKNLRLRYKFHQNEYSNDGWMLYRKDNKLPNYKLRIDVLGEDGLHTTDHTKVFVKLRTRGGSEVIIGVFSDFNDASEWAYNTYTDKSNISNIVYANNELTQEYLKWDR
jgi:hypothetical protein